MVRGAVLATVAVGLLPVHPALAADHFVGASRPGASDAGPCTSAAAPCATIQAAVEKSEIAGGGTVHVLANQDGRTTDTYAAAVVLDGSAPVDLVGAGRRANGTRIAPGAGIPLALSGGTSASSLRLSAPGSATAVTGAAGSAVDEVLAEAVGGLAYAGAGRVEDSRLIGATGARLDGARLVRTEIVSTLDGVVARSGTSALLQVIVRPRSTAGAPPTGDALRVGGGSSIARAELRHVTLTGFPTRLRVDSRIRLATLQAVNATLAGADGTDLQLRGAAARAKLRTVNLAPARTLLTEGARVGNLAVTDPVDLLPELTPDGELSPTSALIDRGTPEGLFSHEPDDASDIRGERRLQGAAPDIGAGEVPPARPDGLRWITVATVNDPMWLTSPPGDLDRLFVVERPGRVVVIDDGQLLPTPALDVSAKITQASEGGLQSIAFAPDFDTSRRVYGFYTRNEDPGTPEIEFGDIVIAEWTMDPTDPNVIDPATEREVMVVEHSAKQNHNGGGLLFGPDGYLWLSLGDGDTQPIPSQDLSRLLGKVLRIDPREADGMPYTIPPDNPFVDEPGAAPEVWVYGFRNPFRMGFDAVNGDLWIGDVGQNRFEELNLLRGADGRLPGANFGWRITEGDAIFQTGAPVTPANAPPNYVGPVVVRRHDEGERSVTAGSVVRDPTIPALAGRFLYADFFLGITRAAVGAPGGVSSDGEVTGLPAVSGVNSYAMDACRRVYATSLFTGAVLRLATTGQCVPQLDACTIAGTPGNDRLVGTAGPDVICGLGGHDKLVGQGGDDLIVGGDGDDELQGRGGADVLQGGAGSDLADYGTSTAAVTVTIGTGADDGTAGEGDDVQLDVERVLGGSGPDQLTAAHRRVRLIGGGSADVLRGSPQDDVLEGREGDDELEGGDGHDELEGGDGGDLLRALDGIRDRLLCGPGADTDESDPVDLVDASCE
jgi:glucose/arabinose dehydrogenase